MNLTTTKLTRREVVALLGASAVSVDTAQAQPAPPKKVLRYAFIIAETGFDPAQVSDAYSRRVTGHIFEALYTFDHLARPSKIKPLTAAGMPETSNEFRTFTVKVRPGIYFADDPAFKGRKRELVAQDYAYVFKRIADPALKSPGWGEIEEFQFIGLSELREEALKGGKPFDYDHDIEGLKVLDRYTIQFNMKVPRPRLTEQLAACDLHGAVAREVVEFYGDRIPEHPVGTGPFRLAQWRRSSFIALDRSPYYRDVFYDADPAADDAEGQAWLKRFKGRRLPMIDRVEISIIEEAQPMWLSFLNDEFDLLWSLPNEFVTRVLPNGKLAPNLAKKGMQAYSSLGADLTIFYFNMDDPVVGGYSPERVALRRAISLGYDVDREIRLIRRGQAVPAQGPLSPGTSGYDPKWKTENSDYDPPRAKALLDLYGYTDRNGDGWREQPDGSPLLIRMSTEPDNSSRQFNELWKKAMNDIGVRTEFKPAKWPENMKSARAGSLMTWQLGEGADVPDGQNALARYYGPQAGAENLARFKRPEFDALYDRMQTLPDGPEREALFRQAERIATAWMPYKNLVNRIFTDLAQPQLTGFRRPIFWQDWWHYVDIDPRLQKRR